MLEECHRFRGREATVRAVSCSRVATGDISSIVTKPSELWRDYLTPTVSVIMPTKNRIELARRAIDSTLNQSFKDWELIILDDSSVENKKKVEQLIRDPRIRVVARPPNSSVALARSIGVNKALGEFVTFLDSDDYYSPERLDKHLQVWLSMECRLGLSWDVCVEFNGDSRPLIFHGIFFRTGCCI